MTITKKDINKFKIIGKVIVARFSRSVIEDMDRDFSIRDTKIFNRDDKRVGFSRTVRTFDHMEGTMATDRKVIQKVRV